MEGKMKRILLTTLAALMLTASAQAQNTPVSVATMPPSVIQTIPQAGDTNVDPSLKEVRVTFSKDMMTEQMWSWAMNSNETFPEIEADKIHYLEDRRTCVMPVKLKPGKTYIIWINSQKYNAFRDTTNNPAAPYLLVFQTGSETSASHVNTEDAVSAALSWLTLVDNKKYVKSWDEASQYFKNTVTSKQWSQIIQATLVPLGGKISRKLKSTNYATSLPDAPDGEYVVIQYETSFENKRSAIETITPMLDKDGRWRVSGYYIK